MAGGATSEFFGDWHALLFLLLSGVIPNEIRRMLGPCSSGGGIDEGSDLLMWVSAVATVILAGVIAEILVQPRGAGKRARLPALWRAGGRLCRLRPDRRSIFAGGRLAAKS
jgi:hypothetical protein